MAMKPRAMKNGKTKKMMRGGMADKPMAMKNGGKAGANKNDTGIAAHLAQKETAAWRPRAARRSNGKGGTSEKPRQLDKAEVANQIW
jgi:hypothetical protein